MRRHLVASVCCGVVIAGASIAGAVVLAHVVAGIIGDSSTRDLAYWAPALVVLAALWSARAVAQWAQARLGQRGATAAIAETNARILTTVTSLPPRDLARVHDDAALLVTRGIDGLRPYFTRYLPAVVLAGIVTPTAVVTMACYDLGSAVVVLIALPLIPLFMVLIGLVTRDRSAASLAAMGTLQARLLDLVAGIPTLRALGRAEGAIPRIDELAAAHRRSAMATLRIAFLSALVLELLATLGVALVAVSVGLRLVFGEIPLANALTALLLAPEVFWPLRRVGVEYHAARDGTTASEQATALLSDIDAPTPGVGTVVPEGATIELVGVGVDGRDGPAPDGLTATIAPGTVTVLTGPNGAGKSTVLQTILGLVPPTTGRVLVDGHDVTSLDPTRWWAQIAWLAQRPVLIPGTIRENLELFGRVVRLDEACRAAGFDEVLAGLPDGLDTVVGRDGVGLSLGQRQRLGLARALGSDARLLLLDEPTAHLDDDLEHRVLEAIAERARTGATVVVVGHRDVVRSIGDHVITVGGASLVH
ncbi:thiol reductant ABC exporter subunit CydD [Mycolicibacterium sediminis]|uniref:thiol reductant ABC exporter subunit CydD n=1 Tax=Mycolicibacterium sediminis TaxID=1286180 RepID=UPI0013D124F4|nr:thiol reductant ABC exporter subunit CydD [Mycolicibacterium sediminis]